MRAAIGSINEALSSAVNIGGGQWGGKASHASVLILLLQRRRANTALRCALEDMYMVALIGVCQWLRLGSSWINHDWSLVLPTPLYIFHLDDFHGMSMQAEGLFDWLSARDRCFHVTTSMLHSCRGTLPLSCPRLDQQSHHYSCRIFAWCRNQCKWSNILHPPQQACIGELEAHK